MRTKIIAEKTIVGMDKAYEIVSIENVLQRDELPESYLTGACFYKDPMYTKIHFDNFVEKEYGHIKHIMVGDTIHEDDVRRIISAMAFAGQRLYQINKRLKELKKWIGEVEFVI